MAKRIEEFRLSTYLKKRYGYERVARWKYYIGFYCRKLKQMLPLVLCLVAASAMLYFAHAFRMGYKRDMCLSLAVGLLVYFVTVQCGGVVRRIRIKRLLRHHYRFFKERTIDTFLSLAEVNYFEKGGLREKLMKPKEFRAFFAAKQDGSDKLGVVMNNLEDCPSALQDLRVEIRLFFDRVISLVSSVDISVNALDRILQYVEHYNRLQNLNLVNRDTKYLAESLYQCFSDVSFVDGRPSEFACIIDEI